MANTELTNTIIELLRDRYSDRRRYICACEVSDTTGLSRRRLDMVVLHCYASESFALEGFEVKVSKSDLMRELHEAAKHNIFYADLDYYNLVCPVDVYRAVKDIIPEKWGVITHNGEFLRCVRKPVCLHDEGTPTIRKDLAASMMRRAIMDAGRARAPELEDAYQRGYLTAKQECDHGAEARRMRKLEDDLDWYKETFGSLEGLSYWDVRSGLKLLQKLDCAKLTSTLSALGRLKEYISDLDIPDDLLDR